VDLAHHTEDWAIRLDSDPSVTHLEWLSLTFRFTRQIQGFPSPLWLLAPAGAGCCHPPLNFSSAFLLESRWIDATDATEAGPALLLNFTQLRNLEKPPSSPVRWSWISFQFLLTPELPEFAQPYFDAFTLEISFALHRALDGGRVISYYEKGTTKPLEFQLPLAASCQAAGTETQAQASAVTERFSKLPLFIHFCAWRCI
jgi:hypothetical protein